MTETVVVCNNCEVPAQTDRRNDGELRVHCPVCGADFGAFDEVQERIPAKLHEPLHDRYSWRAEEVQKTVP